MKIEALNCPNCGAGVSSDAAHCHFCQSRLKTMACPSCFGLMFLGSSHCSHCGAKTVTPQIISNENSGDCPRCRVKLNRLQIEEINLRECKKCSGLWADAKTFEAVCANRESQAVVMNFTTDRHSAAAANKTPVKVNYVPCPDCRQLMNRSNFARSSGVIIDLCKQHGVWFDTEELPRIIEFVRQGGLDHARQKEKLQIENERSNLRAEQYKLALGRSDFERPLNYWDSTPSDGIREFVRLLFD